MTSQTSLLGISGPVRAVVLGGRGGIGSAFVEAILRADPRSRVVSTSRSAAWAAAGGGRHVLDITHEGDVAALAERLSEEGWVPNVVINTVGVLHDGDLQPERTWRRLDPAALHRSFAINAVGPALLIKHLLPLMPRGERAVFASLSARIGSIGDNRLGGWYSYRASKAAHNMLLKTASIEAKRRWPQLVIAALHPGTVETGLSAPFRSSVPEGKLFTPAYSVERLCTVLAKLSPGDSGGHFAYDGSPIEW
jgi:NAD(P)-dependent dehydrogenase (short-subunit alcohol dehydrogenase family)